MASAEYDEDLGSNPFFECLCKKFPDLLHKAMSENYIIAVPRRGVLRRLDFSLEELSRHILEPDDDFPFSRFRSLDKEEFYVEDSKLKSNSNSDIEARILFTESFYDDDLNKVQLWCLKQSLLVLSSDESQLASEAYGSKCIQVDASSVADCVEFLRKFVGGQSLVRKIESCANDLDCSRSECKDLDRLVREVENVYNSCVTFALNFTHVRPNKSWHPVIALAVESYFLHCAHQTIFENLALIFSKVDVALNRLLRQASHLQIDPSSLGIRPHLRPVMLRARKELIRMTDFTTPRSKQACLDRCFSIMLSESEFSDFVVSADDLLPTLVFILTKISVANWFAQLHFMSDFRLAEGFGGSVVRPGDKTNFQLATLEAALEHIKSGGISMMASAARQNKSSLLGKLFRAVEENDLEQAKSILSKSSVEATNNLGIVLCHPLCTCRQCAMKTSETDLSETKMPVLEQTTSQGWTALHYAACLGRPLLIEKFLSADRKSAEKYDVDGKRPIHLAATFGQQNALLQLLYASVDFNVRDNDGNTPIILSSGVGSLSCVKALLFYAEHQSKPIEVNAANVVGDTALHLAARWGFEDVVHVLLEYGADVLVRNKRRETPRSIAQNMKLRSILTHATQIENLNSKPPMPPDEMESSDELTRIFKAIRVGDLNCVAAYLEVDVDCYPFCSCEKCSSRLKRGSVSMSGRDSRGQSALHVAAESGKLPIVESLLSAGAEQIQDHFGQAPLHLACKNGHLAVAEALLSSDSRSTWMNAQDRVGRTPLHLSVSSGNYDVVSLLLARGSNVLIRDHVGLSALDLAESNAPILELITRQMSRSAS